MTNNLNFLLDLVRLMFVLSELFLLFLVRSNPLGNKELRSDKSLTKKVESFFFNIDLSLYSGLGPVFEHKNCTSDLERRDISKNMRIY
jgi:hypothetical protein